MENLMLILLLIAASAFFSLAEISLAASRKTRLSSLAAEGNLKAKKVLQLQDKPGHFFTAVQVGLNAIAILGGIIGESVFTPHIIAFLQLFFSAPWIESLAFTLSVFFVTSLFILFADLIPKRIAMIKPESISTRLVAPMLLLITLFKPFILFFNGMANSLLRLFKVPTLRPNDITPDDIVAMMEAGAQAGVIQAHEHHVLENVMEMESRTVTSAMTPREDLVFFMKNESTESIKTKFLATPYSRFMVCDQVIDQVIGYVEARDLLVQFFNQQEVSVIKEGVLKSPLMIPDTLTLYEVLEHFKSAGMDYAIIMNEYAMIVGIITLQDVMNTVMGDLVSNEEEQIVRRDDSSWLIDGLTPLEDVLKALDIDSFPAQENYETLAGFVMFSLRKIPKRTDYVLYAGYKFEVVDIDNYKIDQLLVSKIEQS